MRRENGRKYFYQWEVNQQLIVDEACTIVHFANGTTEKSLSCAVIEEGKGEGKVRLVNVPNILLQTPAELHAYAWDGASVVAHTVFSLVARPKPAEYVYTETEVKQYEMLESELIELAEKISDQDHQIIEMQTRQEAQSSIQSQGRSAKYSFTSPGWKRVLNIIRTSGGVVNFGIAQSYPLYMSQAMGICFSGFVKYKNDTTTDKKPVLYQLYNNLFGENDAMQNPGRITAVRIGYPDPKQANYNNGTSDALTNPINCYMDVLVEFDKDTLKSKSISFNLNYSGFADSHNCVPITEETAAGEEGIYGEKLLFHTLELQENAGLYTPVGMADIQGYVKAGDGDNILSIPGLKSGSSDYGLYGFKTNSTDTMILPAMASNAEIDARSNKYKPIVPNNLDYAVQSVGDQRYVRSVEGKTPDESGNVQVIDDTKIGADAWSSQNLLDKLCQAIHETGSAVRCEPMDGFPLEVIQEADSPASMELIQTGRNLFEPTLPGSAIRGLTATMLSDGSFRVKGTPEASFRIGIGTITLPPGTYTFGVGSYIKDTDNKPEIYCRLIEQGAEAAAVTWVGVNRMGRSLLLTKSATFNVEIVIHNKNREIDRVLKPQIEVGSVATQFEKYCAKRYTVDFNGLASGQVRYHWGTGVLTNGDGSTVSFHPQPILPITGVNCIYTTQTNSRLTVNGYSDPKKLFQELSGQFEMLSNAIVALGVNI